ncbi:MAG: TMEM165/GDT1 family protein [Thermodesulfobacteriota bacterium]
MQIKMLLAVFFSVFLAELGDKTQLATVCFASDDGLNKYGVFLASAAALVVSTALAVLVGSTVSRFVQPQHLKIGAGAIFVILGIWTLWEGFRSPL